MSSHAEPFVRGLFQGRLAGETLCPYPTPEAEEAETIEEVRTMVADWAADAIDPVAIDEQKSIPQAVIDGLAELGILGPVVGLVALHQSLLVIRHLVGAGLPTGDLTVMDAWTGETRQLELAVCEDCALCRAPAR